MTARSTPIHRPFSHRSNHSNGCDDKLADAYCSPMCQHPACWPVQKKYGTLPPTSRITYSTKLCRCEKEDDTQQEDSDDDSYGLPTQKVLNLFQTVSCDEDIPSPSDTSLLRNSQSFNRSASVPIPFSYQSQATSSGNSKARAPHTSPASALRSRSALPAVSRKKPAKQTSVKNVEVQEVFDIDDLHSHWKETFRTQTYFVWVPNPQAKPKRLAPLKSVPIKDMKNGKHSLHSKDMTEVMLPKDMEVAWASSTHRRTRDSSPPTGGQFHRSIESKSSYNGVYDLLELPKEVIQKILDVVPESEFQDKMNFSAALINLLPDLEKENTSISMATSEVLQNRKLNLLDSKLKSEKKEFPPPNEKIYYLDEKAVKKRERREMKKQKAKEMTWPFGRDSNLPDIMENKNENNENTRRNKMSSVRHSAPSLQTMRGDTRPFHYLQSSLDFTIGPIQTPSLAETSSVHSSDIIESTVRATIPTDRTDLKDRVIQSPEQRPSTEIPKTPQDQASQPDIVTIPYHAPHPPHAAPMVTFTPGTGTFTQEYSSQNPPLDGRIYQSSPEQRLPIQEKDDGSSKISTEDVILQKMKSGYGVTFDVPVQPPTSPSDSLQNEQDPDTERYTTESLRVDSGADSARKDLQEITPEPWPQIDEEALNTVTPPAETTEENSPYNRETTALSGPSSVHSEHVKKIMEEQAKEAPHPPPPPPSPEPKDDPIFEPINLEMPQVEVPSHIEDILPPKMLAPIQTERDPTLSSRETHGVHFLEDLAESDSEMTISAKPPSNLDDYSNINTPNFSRPSTVDHNNGLMFNVILTHRELSKSGSDLRRDGYNPQAPVHATPSQLVNMNRDRWEIPEVASPSEETDKQKSEETDKQNVQPEDSKANQEQKNENEAVKNDLEVNTDPLDQFDATDETFKQELREEYERLSEPKDEEQGNQEN